MVILASVKPVNRHSVVTQTWDMVEFEGERYLIWNDIRGPGGKSSAPVAVLGIHLDPAKIVAQPQETTDSAGRTEPLYNFDGHVAMSRENLKILPLEVLP